jgi:hypothetical protein
MMSLDNLCGIGQLKAHPVNESEIAQVISAASKSLDDASVAKLSNESRFDLAYKAIMQSALAALMTKGFRPNTQRPGHHVTVIQTLSLTIGIPAERWVVLDALRRRRNLVDYTGDCVDDVTLDACIEVARQLLDEVRILRL